ncbi:hypothetical protein NM688_g8655 [Phlebia brevispora]|uniref:Uncharacterized protein n=1 Tax=Phlebia brevispora TaxID=194682 RepID=A0ACC1RP85_9APHY|nr:hypothetical protein NM688_g8655 [Phlebia brevispora]
MARGAKSGSRTSRAFRGFVAVDAKNASARKAPRVPRELSEIPFDHLHLDEDQRISIKEIYTAPEPRSFSRTYKLDDESDQVAAVSFLAANRLDFDARECLDNKWNIRWSGKGDKETWRVLYQCACGCASDSEAKMRRTPVEFTGCLAHGEVMYEVKTHRILLVRGYFEHNYGCQSALFTRVPTFPIHPSVFEVALKQLKTGATFAAVKEHNRKMFEVKAYPLQPDDISQTRYRWLLGRSDSRSLYRQFHQLQGIKITQPDHINIDEWLDPNSPQYQPVLREAIFHYSARRKKSERFEACISTPEMKEAAWQYAHHSQIILDGTFGICNKKMLLFIVMGVDEANRGVPLAFFLFSAPHDNQHTSAGYNTEVLERMLTEWKKAMGKRGDEEFDVWVAITDTDLMERGALLRVFPRIWLLICQFHIRQSWKNHRASALKGISRTHAQLRARLKALEDALVATEAIDDARSLLTREREALIAQRAQEPDLDESEHTAMKGALEHIDYLENYWTRDFLWQSWSRFGRLAAAAILKRDVNEVLPTTNHLESFNGVLKRSYLLPHQRGGRRLRLDILIHLLIFRIFPSIFKRRALEDRESARRAAMIMALPGGALLLNGVSGAGSQLPRPWANRIF